jgi:hypothetical protein
MCIGDAFEVEFMTLDGNTLTIETLTAQQIRAAPDRDMPHVRERPVAASGPKVRVFLMMISRG